MDKVRLSIQIDFGIGDAVFPGPRVVEYPSLLHRAPLKLRAYPIEAAIAEKFQAMVELDLMNSRMKDFYDVRAYARNLEFDGETLARSFAATFDRRATPLPTAPPPALTPAYFAAPAHVQQWRAFTKRIGEPEDDFAGVIAEIAEFLMPPTIAAATNRPFMRRWKPPGPWKGLRAP